MLVIVYNLSNCHRSYFGMRWISTAQHVHPGCEVVFYSKTPQANDDWSISLDFNRQNPYIGIPNYMLLATTANSGGSMPNSFTRHVFILVRIFLPV